MKHCETCKFWRRYPGKVTGRCNRIEGEWWTDPFEGGAGIDYTPTLTTTRVWK